MIKIKILCFFDVELVIIFNSLIRYNVFLEFRGVISLYIDRVGSDVNGLVIYLQDIARVRK